MEVFANLGIDWRLLLSQLVNFGILLFLLHRFAYKPILSMLANREETIEKSLANAKAIEERLRDAERTREEIIAHARAEAADIVESVQKLSEKKRTAALEKTKVEVAAIIADAREKIGAEKEQMLVEARQRFGDLVIKAASVVIEHGTDTTISDAVVKKVVAKASQSLDV